VRHGAGRLVERQAGHGQPAGAGRTQQQPGRDPGLSVRAGDPHGVQRGRADGLQRRGVEAEDEAPLVTRRPRPVDAFPGEAAQQGRLVLLPGCVERRADARIVVADGHRHPGHVPQGAQLGPGAGGVLGAATAQQHDLADPAAPQCLQRVSGDVRTGQRVRVGEQDAGDVEGDVAGADHHDAFGGQVGRVGRDVGVAVVPGDEGGGGEAARGVLAGDVQPPVAGRALGRVVHGRLLTTVIARASRPCLPSGNTLVDPRQAVMRGSTA
jgi:hypothetical protein